MYGETNKSDINSIKQWLMSPLTFSVPAWCVLLISVVSLLLVFAALD